MRRPLSRAAATLLAVALSCAAPARAQVTVNPGALDLLPSQPQRPAPQRAPAPRPAAPARSQPTAPQPAQPQTAAPHAAAPAAPSKPTLPAVPPAIAALPPAAPVPPARREAPPTVPVAADAPGTATPNGPALRITFGTERQDLNPGTEAALRDLARAHRSDAVGLNVYAYASGSPDDPSSARRLSLGRALAARAVLINEGIPSTRIYPRALGPAGGATDPDRVDIVPGASQAPAPAPAIPPTAPAQPR